MPTLLIESGFRFFFYSNEHEPKHVHVIYGDDFAKIEIGSLDVVNSYMKAKDLKRALQIMEANQVDFERKWDEYFS